MCLHLYLLIISFPTLICLVTIRSEVNVSYSLHIDMVYLHLSKENNMEQQLIQQRMYVARPRHLYIIIDVSGI